MYTDKTVCVLHNVVVNDSLLCECVQYVIENTCAQAEFQ